VHGRVSDPYPPSSSASSGGFLGCGILAHGLVGVHCDTCALDRVVAFSCKGRGFCRSCWGRRMADTAAHLVDRVLPEVPVRQWVLSLPFALRYRLAYDAQLTSAVLGVFVRTVFSSLRRRARKHWGVERGQCGAVTFVQRFGDALNRGRTRRCVSIRSHHPMTPRSRAWSAGSPVALRASSNAAPPPTGRVADQPPG